MRALANVAEDAEYHSAIEEAGGLSAVGPLLNASGAGDPYVVEQASRLAAGNSAPL